MPKTTPEICTACKNPPQKDQKLKLCGGCQKAKYCRRECQRSDWKEHKKKCKAKKSKASKSQAKPQKKQKQKKQKEEKQVLWEDQKRINKFGQLNNRLQEIKDIIKKKKAEVDNLKEAVEDIETLLDDDACKIKIGEVYVEVSNEEAEEFSNKRESEAVKHLNVLKEEAVKIEKEMAGLKTLLYAKFGNTINLETNPTKDPNKHLRK